jgi:hypothetical protein
MMAAMGQRRRKESANIHLRTKKWLREEEGEEEASVFLKGVVCKGEEEEEKDVLVDPERGKAGDFREAVSCSSSKVV